MGLVGWKRLLAPRGKPSTKLGALPGRQRLIRQCGVTPLMYQYGDTMTIQAEEVALISPFWHPLTPFECRKPSGPWKLRAQWPPRFLHGSLFFPIRYRRSRTHT